ncbi:MAG: plastocyanin/azurin family copper-binding protein [Byssovorax sp.]
MKSLASTAKWALLATLALGAFGCELLTNVDRNKIDGIGGSGGSAPQCTKAEDCTDPGNECVARTCDSGKCGTTMVAAGTAIAAQTKGDCQVTQCDGAGKTANASDDLDVPTDTNPCTDDACTGGVPSTKPAAAGTSCGATLQCDGAGNCVGCVDATTCPGQDDECSKRTCDAGVCGNSFTAAGVAVAAQTAGDCLAKQCDGAGSVHTVPDNTDLPVDSNECTGDVCTLGVPSNPPTSSGSVCTTPGNTLCDGAGKCVQCTVPTTCPGVDGECQVRTCTAGVCGIALTPAGTAAATQIAGDCMANKCDGAGASKPVVDDLDLPDDSNPCTNDVCTSGAPSHTPAAGGTVCGAGQACNGAGACTGCVLAATCPGSDTECQTRTCVASTCGFNFTAAGTAVSMQTPGDCKKNFCNGTGGIAPATDNSDVPVDGVTCTSDVCTGGVPSNPPVASGLACAQNGGAVCNGGGVCVQCLVASSCAGTDTDCHARTCAAGVCGVANAALGTVTSTQTTGDCKENQCDGAGSSAPVTKNADLPVDGNQCTSDVCTAGAPSNPPTAAGTGCNQMGGMFCSGAGSCVQCGINANCASGVCSGNVCQAPSCTDGVKNGAETGPDCGGGGALACPTCGLGVACAAASDCTSGICTNSVCSQINGCDFSNAVDITGAAFASVDFGGALGLTYSPNCLKVDVGTAVTFNGDFAGHPLVGGQVVGGSKMQASMGPFLPITSTGMTATFTMSSTGTFPYYCDFHALSGMTGVVFVVP